MPVTELTLVFLGSLATLTGSALFLRVEPWTRLVLIFLSSVLWGITGMSAFDVVVARDPLQSEPNLAMAIVGIGLSLLVGVYALHELAVVFGDETGATDADGLL